MEGRKVNFDLLITELVEEHAFQLRRFEALKSERDWLRDQLGGSDWVPQERSSGYTPPHDVSQERFSPSHRQASIADKALCGSSDADLHPILPLVVDTSSVPLRARQSVAFSEDDAQVIRFGAGTGSDTLPICRSRSAAVIQRNGSLPGIGDSTTPSEGLFPMTPRLHPVWSLESMPTVSGRSLRPSHHSKTSSSSWRQRAARQRTGDLVEAEGSACQCLVIRPSSVTRLIWDILSTLLVLYDIVNIPMEAFEPKLTKWTILLDWLTTTFWTSDMILSSLTGYNCDGVVMMEPSKTVRHYLRTSFPLDLFALTSDYLMLILAMHAGFNSLGVLRMNKTVRLVRVLRIIRITRLSKVQHVLGSLFDKIQSESFRMMLSIGLLLLVIVLLNHYIACVWYIIGNQNHTRSERNWVDTHKLEAHLPEDELDLWYWYFTSLHWSLTQFTPASMEVHAVNQTERIYSVCVLLFALVTFSSFVSSITGAMTRLRQLRQTAWTQQAVLRRYFLQNKISVHLGQGVFEYLAKHRKKDHDKLHEDEVIALKFLPTHLLGKIREEIYMPVLTEVPVFDFVASVSAHILFQVCHTAMSTRGVQAGEYLFVEGKTGEKMLYISAGILNFKQRASIDTSSTTDGEAYVTRKGTMLSKLLGFGDWISEPSLWISWIHSGRLMAEAYSEIVELNASHFQAVFSSPYHVHGRDILRTYAQLFADKFMKLDPPERNDLCFSAGVTIALVHATEEILEPDPEDPTMLSSQDVSPTRVKSGEWSPTSSRQSRSSAPTRRFFPSIFTRRGSTATPTGPVPNGK